MSRGLHDAIHETVAYADVFSYPLTREEIHRYLIDYPATYREVTDTLPYVHNLVEHDGYIMLAGRESIGEVRIQREAASARLWPAARKYGALIADVPFVRMVAVTGSLAVNNVDSRADIDYMIVTEPGYLWLSRLMIISIVRLAQRRGITLCPNYIVSEDVLHISDQNLFTARELVQMVPLNGFDTYKQMRERNIWTLQYLPNALGYPSEAHESQPERSRSQRTGEYLLRHRPGQWLDQWEMRRKIRKLTAQGGSLDEVDFTPDMCKGHFDAHQKRIMHAFQARLNGSSNGQKAEDMPAPLQSQKKRSGMKLLFGQSYYLRFDAKLWDAMQPYPPLGTLYAAAYLRERGFDVGLFDAMLADSEIEWAQALDHEQPDYAIIYEDNFNYLSKMCLTRMREAALMMIDMAKKRNIPVIVCGSDATDHYDYYLDGGADYVLIGEGEETLAELLDSLTGENDLPPQQITGVVCQTNRQPSRRPVMKKLDDLPLPAWDLVDVDRYKAIWYEHHGYYSMNMVTTRGCPYHCNWCAKPIWGQRYNVHSPERVAAQLKHLKDHYQPDHIWFVDDIMGLKPGWMERYADLVEAQGIRTPFKCLSRVDLLLRGDTIPALKRAGCDIIWVGAESGSQKILDAMEKGTTVQQIREATARLHDAGVKVAFFLQFGYPGETRDDIEQTLQLVRDCQPDDIGISVSYPLPGTTFHERVKDELGAKHNWQDSADMAMLYQGPFVTAFYRKLHTVVHKEYRSRKTLTKLLQTIQRPATFQRSYLRDTAAMIYHILTLPFARHQLNKLAQIPHQGIIELQPVMNYQAAATPTPQEDTLG